MTSTDTKPTIRDHASLPLAGRVAVVTGATSGIGAATARRLAADGAAVALLGRREDRLRALAAELHDDVDARAGAIALATDVTDPAAVERAARRVGAELGRVDLVVANAGAMLAAPFETADTAEWDRMIELNVRGLLRTGRAFAGDLLAAAADGAPADLVHVGSVGGHLVFPTYAVYGATKAAVAHLTRNLRAELGPRGVRVKNDRARARRDRARRRHEPTTPAARCSTACAARSRRSRRATSPTRSRSPSRRRHASTSPS